jgi:ribosome-binding ATPase
VTTELVVADQEAVKKKHEKISKDVKKGDKHALAEEALVKKVEPHLDAGKPANTLHLSAEERHLLRSFFLLTDKPTIFAANVKESDLATVGANPHVAQVRDYARAHHACETIVLSAQLESDLIDLSPEETGEYLRSVGVGESGVGALIRSTYQLLGLRTFFTHNDSEVRAWTVHAGDTAPKAAGVVHTDFERGFIKADMVPAKALIDCGSFQAAREKGHYKIEGKEYVVQDGDVLLFKFHV